MSHLQAIVVVCKTMNQKVVSVPVSQVRQHVVGSLHVKCLCGKEHKLRLPQEYLEDVDP